MTTYSFVDESGETRLRGTIDPALLTDDIFTFTEVTGAGQLLPILAVVITDDIPRFTVAGNHLSYLLNAAPVAIVGSTGNNGSWQSSDATYNSGTNRTTFTANVFPPDPTADGSVQLSSKYAATLELPAFSAVEWVYAKTTATWTSDPAYLWVDDGSTPPQDSNSFMSGVSLGSSTVNPSAQWPLVTIDTDALAAGGSLHGYTLYPSGATISVFMLALDAGGSTGRTTVVVHHHFTDAALAAVKV